MKRYYCTYFDKNFIPRGFALHQSLLIHSEKFVLYILALDNYTYENVIKWENVVVIDIKDYNQRFGNDNKKFKHPKEFFFTMTPKLCIMCLERIPKNEILYYFDADIFFFSSTDALYENMEDKSISAALQNRPFWRNWLGQNSGIYNVGINGFKNDAIGNLCLKEWNEDCEEWNYEKPNSPLKFFSDQIYLDSWQYRYKEKFYIFQNIGINVAPWNAFNYKFRKKSEIYYVNNKSLVAFHFAGLKKVSENKWQTSLSENFVFVHNAVKNLYEDYLTVVSQNDININFNIPPYPTSLAGKIYKFLYPIFGEFITIVKFK